MSSQLIYRSLKYVAVVGLCLSCSSSSGGGGLPVADGGGGTGATGFGGFGNFDAGDATTDGSGAGGPTCVGSCGNPNPVPGAFCFCKAASRHLLKAKTAGRIVNISSVVGEQGNAGQVSYSSSTAGLLGLTRTLAREFAGRGVTVNAVAPGFVSTKMTDDSLQGDRREKLLASIPLGRIGEAKDIAEAVRFLSSPAAGYITGQVLRVNGGLYM